MPFTAAPVRHGLQRQLPQNAVRKLVLAFVQRLQLKAVCWGRPETAVLFTSAQPRRPAPAAPHAARPGRGRRPELPWVERRPIARLAAFGDSTDKPVITAKALREQKAVIIGKPEWPGIPQNNKKYMGNIAKDFLSRVERPPEKVQQEPLIKYSRTITTRRRTPPSKNSC